MANRPHREATMNVYAATTHGRRFSRILATTQPNMHVGRATVDRFADKELHAIVHDQVTAEPCLVIGSLAPPDEQSLSTLMLIDALRRSGATAIHVFLPYMGYARQDAPQPRESGGIALFGTLLAATGVTAITTIDIHSEAATEGISIPVQSLSSAPLFVPFIRDLQWPNLTIVAPDEGARQRATALARILDAPRPIAYFVKKRVNGVVHGTLTGEVSDAVVVIDDILDTGDTLLSACRILKENGVRHLAIAVTHGLFTRTDWPQWRAVGVDALFVTDSCPEALAHKQGALHVIPCVQVFIDALESRGDQ